MSIPAPIALIIKQRTKRVRYRNRAGPSSKTGNPYPVRKRKKVAAASKSAPVGETPAAVQEIVPGRASDWDHPNLGWTVQHGTVYENTDPIPGQVFVAAQLPDPKAQAAAGIHPATSNAGLVVLTNDEAKAHPGGPEPHDLLAGTAVYAGTTNAGASTAPGASNSPATASTVANVPA